LLRFDHVGADQEILPFLSFGDLVREKLAENRKCQEEKKKRKAGNRWRFSHSAPLSFVGVRLPKLSIHVCPQSPGSAPLIQDFAFAALLDHLFDFGLNQFRAGDNGFDFLVGQIRPDGLFDAGEMR
jgi:hypothetical protein